MIITIDIGYTQTGVRDFGLTLALFVVFLIGADKLSLDKIFARKFPKYKIILKILCIFFVLIGLIIFTLVIGAFVPNDQVEKPMPNVVGVGGEVSGGVLSLSLVSQHNTPENCWFVINGKVYDVTNYLSGDFHPGGDEIIIPFCGKDATSAFASKGDLGEDHSESGYEDLEVYIIGNIGDEIATETSPPFFTWRWKY